MSVMSQSVFGGRKLYECSVLPAGWRREEVCRKSSLAGAAVSKYEVVYSGPGGVVCRNKHELARALGRNYDLTYFDFQRGRLCAAAAASHSSTTATSGLHQRRNSAAPEIFNYAAGLRGDNAPQPPIRQTASIFKQPVTLVRNFPDGVVKHDSTDICAGGKEQPAVVTSGDKLGAHLTGKPKQLFWEKSLQGLRACDSEERQLYEVRLPRALRPIGPDTDDTVAVRSMASALYSAAASSSSSTTAAASVNGTAAVLALPVTGQSASRQTVEKNPAVFINPAQPLVQTTLISSDDVRHQEDRVSGVRKRLEQAINALTA